MLLRIAALLLALATVCCADVPVRRLGCFVDSHARDLPYYKHTGKETTQPNCLAMCKKQKYKYYALQASSWCFCGNSFGRIRQVPDSHCHLKCMGNKKSTCGGHWRNEVFTTGLDTFAAKRIGCFVDQKSPRDLPEVRKFGGNSLTRQACWDHCKGKKFKFFGLQGGDTCYCGNTHGKYGKANEEGCYVRCRGDHTSTCGGNLRSEIYATGL